MADPQQSPSLSPGGGSGSAAGGQGMGRAPAGQIRQTFGFAGDGISFLEDLPESGVQDEVFCFVDPPYIGRGSPAELVGFGVNNP